MSKTYHNILFLLLATFLISTSCVGNIKIVNSNQLQNFLADLDIQKALKQVKSTYRRIYNKQLSDPVFLKTQVVAGNKYIFGFNTDDGLVQFGVWTQPWMNFVKVEYLKLDIQKMYAQQRIVDLPPNRSQDKKQTVSSIQHIDNEAMPKNSPQIKLANEENPPPLLGGVVNLSNERFQNFVKSSEGVKVINLIKNQYKKLCSSTELGQPIYVNSQVVAGSLITVGFRNGETQIQASVWSRPWMNFLQVQYIKVNFKSKQEKRQEVKVLSSIADYSINDFEAYQDLSGGNRILGESSQTDSNQQVDSTNMDSTMDQIFSLNMPILGGTTKVTGANLQQWLQEQNVQKALAMVRNKYMQKYGKQLGQLTYGGTQVVAGQLMTFGFETEDGIVQFQVLSQPWINKLEIKSLKINYELVQLDDQNQNKIIRMQNELDEAQNINIQQQTQEYQGYTDYQERKEKVSVFPTIQLVQTSANADGIKIASQQQQNSSNQMSGTEEKSTQQQQNSSIQIVKVVPLAGGIRQIRGGELQQWLQGQDVQRALNLVRNRYTQKFNRNLGKPVYGKSQVVAGLLITFGFQTEEGVAEFSVLSQPWMNRLQVTSFRVNGQVISLQDQLIELTKQLPVLPTIQLVQTSANADGIKIASQQQQNSSNQMSGTEEKSTQQQQNSSIQIVKVVPLAGGIRQIRGGELQQWLQGQDVQRALNLVRNRYTQKFNRNLGKPVYGKSQVVAGLLITFGFQTEEGVAEFSVLSQPWMNRLQVTSFRVNGQVISLQDQLIELTKQLPVLPTIQLVQTSANADGIKIASQQQQNSSNQMSGTEEKSTQQQQNSSIQIVKVVPLAGGIRQIRGGELQQWLQGQDVQRALNLVRNRYTQKFNRNLGKPVYGKSQVVAGLLITFGFQTEEGVAEFSVLSQPWMNRLQVTSFRVNGQVISLQDQLIELTKQLPVLPTIQLVQTSANADGIKIASQQQQNSSNQMSGTEEKSTQQQQNSSIQIVKVVPLAGGIRQIRGGELQQWLQGQDVQRALNLVRNRYTQKFNRNLGKPVYGKSQVVAGLLITFGFQTEEGVAEFSVLSQPWMNRLQILSSKIPQDSQSQDSQSQTHSSSNFNIISDYVQSPPSKTSIQPSLNQLNDISFSTNSKFDTLLRQSPQLPSSLDVKQSTHYGSTNQNQNHQNCSHKKPVTYQIRKHTN